MTDRVRIAAAGNTLAPALAALRQEGYRVSRDAEGLRLYRAENERCSLTAEDPLTLLGLAKLFEVRGSAWSPSDNEVSEFLFLEQGRDG